MGQAQHVIRLIFSVAFILLFSIQYATADIVAITHVNVIPMDRETVLHDQTVLIEDHKIIALGPADNTTVPGDASIINGRAKYLIPGLAEMHAHVTSLESVDHTLTLYVANGVTTARGMLGQPWHLKLRDNIANGSVLGPRFFAPLELRVNGIPLKSALFRFHVAP